MKSFKEEITSIGFNYHPIQEQFYNRIEDFMKSDKKILINQGGMGLGKTISTAKILKNNLNKYDLIFIATPTSPLKYTWCKEIKKIGLKESFSVWPSKDSICIFKKIFNMKNFNMNKCNDDCIFRRGNDSTQEYLTKCQILAKEYIELLPKANPKEYYEKKLNQVGYKKEEILKDIEYLSTNKKTINKEFRKACDIDCLYSPSRMCLKDEYNNKQKIIIGDYFGMFKLGMFENVTKRNPSQYKSILIIDEGHLLPWRARDNGSNKIYLKKDIENLEKELYYNDKNISKTKTKSIKDFIKICKEYLIISNGARTQNKKFILFNHDIFIKDMSQLLIMNNISTNINDYLLHLTTSLNDLSNQIKRGDEEGSRKPSCIKIKEYIESLEDNSNKPQYHSTIRRVKYNNYNDILMSIQCIDPSEIIQRAFHYWDKVIILTGTIRRKEKFLSQLGLTNKYDKYEYCDIIKRFGIEDSTFIVNQGDFRSDNSGGLRRTKTYDDNSEKISKLLNTISGKTIIFVQSKKDSQVVADSIKISNCKIINFCKNGESDEIDAEDFEDLKESFSNNKTKKIVGIINIRGRVEGHNFVDEIGNFQLDNVIIYGFPLDSPTDLTEVEYKYNSKLFDSKEKAKVYTSLIEPINKIHQAVYRSKREEKQNPIIVLWDNRFGSKPTNDIFLFKDNITGEFIKLNNNNNIFSNLPEELKKREGSFDELLKFVNEVENERSS